jgi:hypothetical protein
MFDERLTTLHPIFHAKVSYPHNYFFYTKNKMCLWKSKNLTIENMPVFLIFHDINHALMAFLILDNMSGNNEAFS